MKECKECKKELPKADFYKWKHKNGKYYLTSRCKKCMAVRSIAYDKKNIIKKRKRAREYERRKRNNLTITN